VQAKRERSRLATAAIIAGTALVYFAAAEVGLSLRRSAIR
jgi:hypothetical protein